MRWWPAGDASRPAKTTPVPCLVKTDGVAEEDSLAENTVKLCSWVLRATLLPHEGL